MCPLKFSLFIETDIWCPFPSPNIYRFRLCWLVLFMCFFWRFFLHISCVCVCRWVNSSVYLKRYCIVSVNLKFFHSFQLFGYFNYPIIGNRSYLFAWVYFTVCLYAPTFPSSSVVPKFRWWLNGNWRVSIVVILSREFADFGLSWFTIYSIYISWWKIPQLLHLCCMYLFVHF